MDRTSKIADNASRTIVFNRLAGVAAIFKLISNINTVTDRCRKAPLIVLGRATFAVSIISTIKQCKKFGKLASTYSVEPESPNRGSKKREPKPTADLSPLCPFLYILYSTPTPNSHGRIKQGLYPLPAPVGYLDKGKGKVKEIDPVKGPLVKKLFELYATGKHGLHELADTMNVLGLRTRRGGEMEINGISRVLHNPFYIGLIRLNKTNELFAGAHPPLVAKSLFDRVRAVLEGKLVRRTEIHDFIFRRLLKCQHCRYSLIGERQRGHVYYRCHTKACPLTCIRQEAVEAELLGKLVELRFNESEKGYLAAEVPKIRANSEKTYQEAVSGVLLQLAQAKDRLDRVADAYIDGRLDKGMYDERRERILMERLGLEENLTKLQANARCVAERLEKFLELAGTAYFLYETGNLDQKRRLVKIVTSNREASGKRLEFMLDFPFQNVANRLQFSHCRSERDIHRMWDALLGKLVGYFKTNDFT